MQAKNGATMEEERPNNVKALRAKFQEEALLARSKASRPAVAEKPKHLTPRGHSLNIAVENNPLVIPRVLFRDRLTAPGGKQPLSFPPLPQQQTSTSSQLPNGEGPTRQSLKDRHMPPVLPVPPVKEHKTQPQAKKEHKLEPEPGKVVPPQTKPKKKRLLLPFKTIKAFKVNTEEEPTYADLIARPSSAPGELPSMEKSTAKDGASFQSDQSTSELPHCSPDSLITPPPANVCVDSDNRMMSTLEKARDMFSPRRMFPSAEPKHVSGDKVFPPPPPKNIESAKLELPIPPPHHSRVACSSARPFKSFFSSDNSVLDKKAKLPYVRTGEAHPPSAPPKRCLVDLMSPGPSPPKPNRPPFVDLSRYHLPTVNEVSPVLRRAPSHEPESEPASISNPVLDAPEFPDFESTEMGTAEGDMVDFGALEREALLLFSIGLPAPDNCEVTDFEDPQRDSIKSSVCNPIAGPFMSTAAQDLNLGNRHIIPLDPACFPIPINLSEFPEPAVPEQWSPSEEVSIELFSSSHADDTDPAAAESQSAARGTDHSNHASLNDGVQHSTSVYQQDINYEACNDMIYEEVDFKKHSKKSKHGLPGLKNPHAEKPHTNKSSPKWHRKPRGNISGDHAHLAHNLVPGKERQSPNTADYKEQRKREKHRLDKEKKEHKEKEKKENEMKKKFKVSGQEEAMYHAKVAVAVASKVRRHDLSVNNGDTVAIIRTTSCPKGKWLARDSSNNYGYISVMNVELNIDKMMELGKKARGGNGEVDNISIGSRSSNHPVLTSSFTDDSQEWSCDDENLSPSNESHNFPRSTASMVELQNGHVSTRRSLSDANQENPYTQTTNEALQKLAVFFQRNQDDFGDLADSEGITPTNAEPPNFLCDVEEPPYPEQVEDFTELEFLPPPSPSLYADFII